MYSKGPRVGLFSPSRAKNIVSENIGSVIHNTTLTPNAMLNSRKN